MEAKLRFIGHGLVENRAGRATAPLASIVTVSIEKARHGACEGGGLS
jgi:hypothetical protein